MKTFYWIWTIEKFLSLPAIYKPCFGVSGIIIAPIIHPLLSFDFQYDMEYKR